MNLHTQFASERPTIEGLRDLLRAQIIQTRVLGSVASHITTRNTRRAKCQRIEGLSIFLDYCHYFFFFATQRAHVVLAAARASDLTRPRE